MGAAGHSSQWRVRPAAACGGRRGADTAHGGLRRVRRSAAGGHAGRSGLRRAPRAVASAVASVAPAGL